MVKLVILPHVSTLGLMHEARQGEEDETRGNIVSDKSWRR